MNKSLIISVLIFTPFAFATSATDVKDKAGETVEAAQEFTKEQKDAFVNEMENNLSHLKSKIKDLKGKAGKSKNETISKLEKEQKGLENDLATLKKSSGAAWGKVKNGLSKAWSEIKNSVEDAKEELTK